MYQFSSIDLHVHSYYSDGLLSPTEIVELAEQKKLSAISLSDHDTVEGVEEAIKEGIKRGVVVVPGVELSSYDAITNEEIHILGYYFDWKDQTFLAKMNSFKKFREKRLEEILRRLKALGITITKKDLNIHKNGVYGRLHVARTMYRLKKVKNIKEAFDKYLAYGKPVFVAKEKITPKQAIDIIIKAGGVPVLAHPKISGGKKKTIKNLVDVGLKGLEVYYTNHAKADIKKYLDYAKEFNLIATGGSDCHGQKVNEKVLLGTVNVPYEALLRLKEIHSLISNS